MSPDDAELHGNIAAVARRMEDPADAARHLRDALRLAPALAQEQGPTEMGEQIRARLALYRDGRAFLAPDSAGGA